MVASDLVVIGGGIVGFSTALSLRSRFPSASIALLERSIIPTGATSRNAGFACFGSLSEILSDRNQFGSDVALSTVEKRWRGLQMLRERFTDDDIGLEMTGGFELIFSNNLSILDEIGEVNSQLQNVVGKKPFSVSARSPSEFGFGCAVKAVVSNPLEGTIDSGKLVKSLYRRARLADIEVYHGCNVREISSGSGLAVIRVEGGVDRGEVHLQAGHVFVCTNAFIPDLLPQVDITPARGQVVVTSELAGLGWKGAFHFDEGFYYFRNLGNRVLLGGGRNLDFTGEATRQFSISETIQSELERVLNEIILPNTAHTIEHRWSGIMGFSTTKQPIIQNVRDSVTVVFGCNGMGVALATLIGDEASQLVS